MVDGWEQRVVFWVIPLELTRNENIILLKVAHLSTCYMKAENPSAYYIRAGRTLISKFEI